MQEETNHAGEVKAYTLRDMARRTRSMSGNGEAATSIPASRTNSGATGKTTTASCGSIMTCGLPCTTISGSCTGKPTKPGLR